MGGELHKGIRKACLTPTISLAGLRICLRFPPSESLLYAEESSVAMRMLPRRVWCTFVLLLSSQHQTSLPVLRTAPLMNIFRKQSPFSTVETSPGGTAFAVPAPLVVRTGARDLRSTNQVHVLQTAQRELVTSDSRSWESVDFSSGRLQWQQWPGAVALSRAVSGSSANCGIQQ